MLKKIIYLFLILLLASCGSNNVTSVSTDATKELNTSKATAQSLLANIDKERYKEGDLLVKFKSGVVTTSSLRAHQAIGAIVLKRFSIVNNLEHVKLSEGQSVKDAIIKYMSDPNVEYAEPNYIRRALAIIPTDQYFGQQWALRNTGQVVNGIPGTTGADIKATDAWDISKGSSNVIVAVIDSGIDYNHSDLVGNIWINTAENPPNGVDDDGNGKIDDCRGWNFVNNNNAPMDDNGHGTHIAGIIGAVGNNGIGISGVMWNVKLMALKFLNNKGEGYISDEIAAISYAISKGAKIINASFSGGEFSNAEYDAINSANAAGILVIAAAGNGGDDNIGDGDNNDLFPEYPASYNLPNIISVAATDQNDVRAPFSNYGHNFVHVAAPGTNILSTVPTSISPTGFDFYSGTSMATAHVSGLAGFLYSYYTSFNYSQIRSTIFRFGDVLQTLSGLIQTGGRVNAYRALSSLLTPSELILNAQSSSQIALIWIDNATGEDGYKIERKVAGGDYTQITEVPLNTTTYTDSGLSPTTTYTYRVRAYNTIPADSSYSNEASATTPAVPVEPSGGGGGCSIGARQNTPTAVADFAVMLIPLLFVVVMKFRRRV